MKNQKLLTSVLRYLIAHVAGFTGKNVRRGKVNTIIGLDPAGAMKFLFKLYFTLSRCLQVLCSVQQTQMTG